MKKVLLSKIGSFWIFEGVLPDKTLSVRTPRMAVAPSCSTSRGEPIPIQLIELFFAQIEFREQL